MSSIYLHFMRNSNNTFTPLNPDADYITRLVNDTGTIELSKEKYDLLIALGYTITVCNPYSGRANAHTCYTHEDLFR